MKTRHSLSSRDTSHVFISDLGVDSMGNTEDAHDDIPSMLSKLSSSQTGRRMFVLRHDAPNQ
jgi:hypothetical protein